MVGVCGILERWYDDTLGKKYKYSHIHVIQTAPLPP